MKNRKITIAILITVTLALIGWDIYVYVEPFEGSGDTISEVIADYDRRFPIIRFAFGVLIGHWFWPMGRGVDDKPEAKAKES